MQGTPQSDRRLPALLATLLERGRKFTLQATKRLPRGDAAIAQEPAVRLLQLCLQLLSSRGEASGLAMAAEIIRGYAALDAGGRLAFFQTLADDFGPDWSAARAAWPEGDEAPDRARFRQLNEALEPRRRELFRRINRAPGGTFSLVQLRADLLKVTAVRPELLIVDDDLEHLLQSWFNRGFLVMQRIDWSTSAEMLERIIRYEAVHKIGDWEELRRRLLPADRRCYAFFHPAMASEPLIFVEVALTDHLPDSIQAILTKDRTPGRPGDATTAVFYSISNCQPGLLGVSFGSFLIKQVVEELSHELPRLSTFVTLSPVPGFRRWLERSEIFGEQPELQACLAAPDWLNDPTLKVATKAALLPLAASYFLDARDPKGRPLDPVARFHLGNGARLERLCWLGDTSAKGLAESAGLMVNYLYWLPDLEQNHEGLANEGRIAAAEAVKALRRKPGTLLSSAQVTHARLSHTSKGKFHQHVG